MDKLSKSWSRVPTAELLPDVDVPHRAQSQGALAVEPPPDPFPKISATDLRRYLLDPVSSQFDALLILDGRFDYEYRAGHISGARNITNAVALRAIYEHYKDNGAQMLVVFHCEYSQNRGPTLMKLFREHDRKINIARYPHVSFPNIVLMDGGYKEFFAKSPDLCIGGYVAMRHPEHVRNGDLKRSHSAYMRELVIDQAAPNRQRWRNSDSQVPPAMNLLQGTNALFERSSL